MHGRGIFFEAASGDVYDGEFKNNSRWGEGVLTTTSGDKFKVEYYGGELTSKTKID